MNFWHKLKVGLQFAEQVAVKAGDLGITIKGRNPAEVDAAIRAAAKTAIDALRKPVPPAS